MMYRGRDARISHKRKQISLNYIFANASLHTAVLQIRRENLAWGPGAAARSSGRAAPAARLGAASAPAAGAAPAGAARAARASRRPAAAPRNDSVNVLAAPPRHCHN